MSPNSTSPPRVQAIEQLEAFGLSAYAARTFVALVDLGEGTAQDVSRVADVPRTRVYDAVEELQDLGLADVQPSSPKRFWAISADTARRRVEREYARRADILSEALDTLETVPRSERQRGVWTVTGRETVSDRVREFVDTATDEVIYMTVDDLLTDTVVDGLAGAGERGVSIKLGGMSPSVETELEAAVPASETVESLWDWSDTPAGRLLLVDRERTLVSVLVGEDHPGEQRDETAIWGSGPANSLVVVLREMFAWQLDAID